MKRLIGEMKMHTVPVSHATLAASRGKMMLQERLAHARRKTGFGGKRYLADFSTILGVSERRIAELERGAATPSVDELDRYARLLGLSVRDFTTTDLPSPPLASLLLRSVRDGGRTTVRALGQAGVFDTIGEFARSVRAVSLLEPDRKPKTECLLKFIDRHDLARHDHPPFGAETLARQLRLRLGLEPAGAIASMRTLLSDLGVLVTYVSDDELDPAVDGASVASPIAAVLVNLVGDPAGGEHG